MSDSCPLNVCMHRPVRTSQSLAAASQPPDTNVLRSLLQFITHYHSSSLSDDSPQRHGHDVTSVPDECCCLLSGFNVPQATRHISTELREINSWMNWKGRIYLDVIICASSMNLQHERYPVWPGNSRLTRTVPKYYHYQGCYIYNG